MIEGLYLCDMWRFTSNNLVVIIVVVILGQAYASLGQESKGFNSKSDSLYSLKQKLSKEEYEKIFTLLQEKSLYQSQAMNRQQWLIYLLIFCVVAMLVFAYVLYRSIQRKKIANQFLALKSLNSQMNPHFVFNALNSVNSFISKSDTRRANKYLSDFSRLMRTIMENTQKDFVALSEELSVLELYLKLEHFRFKNKFNYELTIEKDLDIDQYRIPPMLMQPYIENAIWHGLRYKEAYGHLLVTVCKGQSNLELIVQDNGIGREKSRKLKTNNQKMQESTGMKNTENRIKLLNSIYNSHITSFIENLNNDKTGTKVIIKIPRKLIEEPA